MIFNGLGQQLQLSGSVRNWVGGDDYKSEALIGSGLSDQIYLAGGDTGYGGAGDDHYVAYGYDRVVERADEGVDTVTAWQAFTLGDNIENLTLDFQAWYGGGNALNNVITAAAMGSTLDGAGGNDALRGNTGADIFVVRAGNGNDSIYNFDVSADKVRLAGYDLSSFDDVRSIMSQQGKDTLLSFGNGERLVLRDLDSGTLTADDFSLSLDMSKLKLTFHDEFNSLSTKQEGGTWNTKYWMEEWSPGHNRYLNDEAQLYMDKDYAAGSDRALGVDPFSIDNGVLSITAAPASDAVKPHLFGKEYTSGVITTDGSFSQQYGYFEIRAALPEGQGMWPAFWLLPTDHSWPPEIDVLEQLGRDPDTVYTTAISDGSWSQARTRVDTSEMHTYGVNWGKDKLTWYIDGTEVSSIPTPADMHKEMYALLNLAVGGQWGGAPDATTRADSFDIDYIRVYANADTVSQTVDGVRTVFEPGKGPVITDDLPVPDPVDPVVPAPADPIPVPPTPPQLPKPTIPIDKLDPVAPTTPVPMPELPTAVSGGTGADRLFSFVAGQFVSAGAGDDYVEVHGGGHRIESGAGNDIISIDATTDVVIEAENGGTDTIWSKVSYTLGDNVENLSLNGTDTLDATGNGLDNILMGNDGDNVLTGLGGSDWLDGLAGNNRMLGGQGDDSYVVRGSADVVVEQANEGRDSVYAEVSYTLPTQVERLVLRGVAALSATGNELDNEIIGNAGDNVITGGKGNDYLHGGGGTNTFTFTAGDGGDIVHDFNLTRDVLRITGVDASTIQVSQDGGAALIRYGTNGDYVRLQNVSGAAVKLGTHVVADTPFAATPENVWGRNPNRADGFNAEYYAAHNPDVVAAGMNMLDHWERYGRNEGRLPYDADPVAPQTPAPTSDANAGNPAWASNPDRPDGFNAAYYLAANPDVAAVGMDPLLHWQKHGQFEGRLPFENAPADLKPSWVATETRADGFNYAYYMAKNPDVVQAGMDALDHWYRYGQFEGRSPYEGAPAGAKAVFEVQGTSGDDWLSGMQGTVNRFQGGGGNDGYVVSNAGDLIVETATGGRDTANAYTSYTLPEHVERLVLWGDGNLAATGNDSANEIIGNGAGNVLTGGKGNDLLIGGGGADTFAFKAGDGQDRAYDFNIAEDSLMLVGVDKASVKLTQNHADTIVHYGAEGDTITLTNVSADDPLLGTRILFG